MSNPRDYLGPIHAATMGRLRALMKLEDCIVEFKPDELEIAALIDAIAKAVRNCRGDDATEVLLQLSLTKNALERLANEMQVDAAEELRAIEEQAKKRQGWTP